MPHVPYSPRPVPSNTPIESPMAPLSSAGIQPDLPSIPQDGPDDFLDDLPVAKAPGRAPKQKRPQIEPGRPRRRESRTTSTKPGLSRVSMASFSPHPGAVAQLLEQG